MKQILIVEDSKDIQTQLKWELSKMYNVLQAYNRPDALTIFKENLPPVVTLDLGLPPEEDNTSEGLACLREMLQKSPKTRIIVVSGNDSHTVASEAAKMGVYAYYKKPVDIRILKAAIQKAFSLSDVENNTL